MITITHKNKLSFFNKTEKKFRHLKYISKIRNHTENFDKNTFFLRTNNIISENYLNKYGQKY